MSVQAPIRLEAKLRVMAALVEAWSAGARPTYRELAAAAMVSKSMAHRVVCELADRDLPISVRFSRWRGIEPRHPWLFAAGRCGKTT